MGVKEKTNATKYISHKDSWRPKRHNQVRRQVAAIISRCQHVSKMQIILFLRPRDKDAHIKSGAQVTRYALKLQAGLPEIVTIALKKYLFAISHG